MVRKLLLIAVVCAIGASVKAQYFNSYKLWQQTRNEIQIGVGPSNYLGELGGANQVGRDFIQDLEVSQSKFSIGFLHRYFLTNASSVAYGFHFGSIAGNDNLTAERFRNNRNIHFKSPILEFSARYEWHFLNEVTGHLYRMRGVRGMKSRAHGTYLFGGIAGFYFNPKAKYQGRWVQLQPLGTEGQGLNGKRFYSRYQLAVPVGMGFRYRVSRLFRLGFEIGVRKTFTDYLDDTSTNYYDPEKIFEARGEVAEYFSNPTNNSMIYNYTINPDAEAEDQTSNPAFKGMQRGNPNDLDSYLFMHLTANIKLYNYSKFHRLRPNHSRFKRYGKKYKPKAKF